MAHKTIRILAILAIVLYIGIGIAFCFTRYFDFVPNNIRILLGVAMIGYGIMRAIRFYTRYTNNR